MTGGPVRVAVMADTHGMLRTEVEQTLQTCDMIIHAGDFDNQLLYHKLSVDWPLYAVHGNNDRGAWAGGLPQIKRFEIGGVKFVMAHERQDIPSALRDAQVVVYGHSHMYQQQEINGRLWLNPGSCGYKRFTLPLSLAVMTIENGSYSLETIWLEKGYGTPSEAISQRPETKKSKYEKRQRKYLDKQERDTLFLITRILRQRTVGNPTEWTAENLNADPAFVRSVYAAARRLPQADARAILREIKQPHRLEDGKE